MRSMKSAIGQFSVLPAFSALFLPGEPKSPKQLSGQRYFCNNKPTGQEKQNPRIQFRSSSQIGPNCRGNEYGIGGELDRGQQEHSRCDRVQSLVSTDLALPRVT